MRTMYPAQVNSPGTELAAAIDASQDTILVADGSVLPEGPNLLTIGTDEAAETILYTGKTGDELTGVTRGFQGTAQSWAAGIKVARYFTAYDHNVTIGNISELSALSDATRDRLDNEEREDVELNAGIQILNAQRRAAFSLSGIKGRTLVNLLGRDGAFESVNPWSAYSVKGPPTVANNEITVIGLGEAINPQIGRNLRAAPAPKVGDKMFIRAIAKTKNACESLRTYLYISSPVATRHGEIIISSPTVDKPYALYKSFTVTQQLVDNWGTTGFILAAQHTSAAAAKDTVAVYSQAALYVVATQDLGLTDDELAAKYPYVNSVQPVRNPYAIRYGENLLPPFYEWKVRANKAIINGPYSVSVTVDNAEAASASGLIPAVEGVDYTLSITRVGAVEIGLSFHDKDGVELQTSGYVNTSGLTVKSPTKTVFVQTHINVPSTSGDYQFNNFMLTLGSTPKPFKPREDAMLGLQTDLYADQLTGENADEVFEKDGQYFKLAKWKKVVLDGSLPWVFNNNFTGFKRVAVSLTNFITNFIANTDVGIKYDGKLLGFGNTHLDGDREHIYTPSNVLYITLYNSDSGWGENYTPTADEIKAYFMGWKMYDTSGQPASVYNRTDGAYKGWVRRRASDGSFVDGTGTLPTLMAPEYTSYQLVYQLATPTVEPIVSEGMLTFNEGDNQIEVGTGLVVRESVFPQRTGDAHVINDINLPGSILNHKVEKFLNVYKNGYRDQWDYRSNLAYGNERRVKYDGYDSTAAYSVTYLMLDKSPIVPFTGSYAANEKAMLQELTDAVQENATAVSVLMNKKADKDAPGWITPTLLNGFINGISSVAYRVKDGYLEFKGGALISGVTSISANTIIFKLPKDMWPKETKRLICVSWNDTTDKGETYIEVSPTSGEVRVGLISKSIISLDSLQFPLN